MTGDVYTKLREFFDNLPAGYPETPTGVELRLLKKLFTPEQADLVMKLKDEPESVEDIAQRTGLDDPQLGDKLEEMARKGLIFRVRKGDTPLYRSYQFVLGLYEFQVSSLDREFCELWEEYLPYIIKSQAEVPTAQMRVIPVDSSLKAVSEVAPYNQVREIIKKEDLVTVTQCICKKEQGLLDNACEKPQEVCLIFGDWARFYLENKNARQITTAEALEVVDMAEENGLVLRPSNTQKLEAICCCCACCCPGVKNIKPLPNPADYVASYYRSTIDGGLCTECGECMEICPMDAIEEEDGASRVIAKRCIGCGLCVGRCPVEAITMVAREDTKEAPPVTFDDTMGRIAKERGIQA